MKTPPELLLSLPPIMCQQLAAYHPDLANRSFATFDPPNAQLGSGGGTAHVLNQAWKSAKASSASFRDWVNSGQRVVLHGGGESRRLPAYAAIGKLLMPFPVLRWSRGQRLGQTLLDMNEPFLQEAFQTIGRFRTSHDRQRRRAASIDNANSAVAECRRCIAGNVGIPRSSTKLWRHVLRPI